MTSIADQIKAVRTGAKLSQVAFAKAIGVSSNSVSNYEVGNTKPGRKVIDKINEVFGAKISMDKETVSTKKTSKAKKPAKAKESVKAKAAKETEKTAVSTKVEPEVDAPAAAAPSEVNVLIQASLGGSISVEEIIARVHAAAPDATEIYVKTEENKAYYVGKKNRGYVILWES